MYYIAYNHIDKNLICTHVLAFIEHTLFLGEGVCATPYSALCLGMTLTMLGVPHAISGIEPGSTACD